MGGSDTLLPLAATRSGARHLAAPGRCIVVPDTPASRAPLRVATNGNFDPMPDLTALLDRLRAGDPHAAGELFDRVYAELKRLAAAQARADAGHSVSPTELVHEAYLRLFPGPGPAFADRAYFFAAAATAMRRVRVDHARARGAAKRGGGRARLDLESGTAAVPEPDLDLVALDEALDRLAARDPAQARLVELRSSRA